MATETRSRHGCWTCRVRKKKCGEEHPNCARCLSVSLNCLGYDKKPHWMDGSDSERCHANIIKSQVAEALRRKRLLQRASNAPAAKASIEAPGQTTDVLSRPSASTICSPNSDTGNVSGSNESSILSDTICPHSPLPGHSSALDGSLLIEASGSVSGQVVDANSDAPLKLGIYDVMLEEFEESHLLVCYFDHVFRWQFRSQPIEHTLSLQKGYLLWLLRRSKAVRSAALALTTAFISSRSSQQTVETSSAGCRHSRLFMLAVAQLRELILGWQTTPCSETCYDDLVITACTIMLISLYTFRHDPDGWRIHHRAAVSIMQTRVKRRVLLCQMKKPADHLRDQATAYSTSTDSLLATTSPLKELEDLLLGQTLWRDMLSNRDGDEGLSHREDDYRVLLLEQSGINLQDVVGCENWVIITLIEINRFHRWKSQSEAMGSLSFWEMSEKAQLIKLKLQAKLKELQGNLLHGEGSGALDLPMSPLLHAEDTQTHTWTVSYIFACCLLLLLEVRVSGARPGNPEIKQQVECIIAAFSSFVDFAAIEAFGWPLLIVGCMASKEKYTFFEALLAPWRDLTTSNLSRIWQCIERCWKLREKYEPLGRTVSWRDAQESLGVDILLS